MTPLEFERRYAPVWDNLDGLINHLDTPKKHAKPAGLEGGVEQLLPLYRQTCHHLALARDRGYPSYLVVRLNDLVQRTHQTLYRPKTRIWSQIWGFVTREFPQLVRANARLMALSTVLFLATTVTLGLICYFQPEFAYSVYPPEQVSNFERMYNPDGKVIGRERPADTDFAMFGFYIKNNVGISFQVFAGGILFGIGSMFYILINGVYIGAVAGYLTQLGYGETFWSFVCGHGAFELTAIVLSGGAGMMMGFALLAPGRLSRRQALTAAAKDAVKIIYGVAGMLVIAAFLEAFWSSSRALPNEVKYGVAAMLWLAVFYYLGFQGRVRPDAESDHVDGTKESAS